MNYHWSTDLDPYKGSKFYNAAMKVFAKLTQNPLFKHLGKEDHLQIKVATYMSTVFPDVLMHHSPNEGKRTPYDQLKVSYFGVHALPDVMIYKKSFIQERPGFDGKLHHIGLAIELKIHPNRPTANQLNILNQLENAGWKTAVCFTLKDTINKIDTYLK